MIICRETYSTDRVILKGRVDAFDHLECGLRLRRWFDKAGNLWSGDDLPQVSRAIDCDCLRAYLRMDIRCVEFSKLFAGRGPIHPGGDLIFG